MGANVTIRIATLALGLALLAGPNVACGTGSTATKDLREKTKSVMIKGGMAPKEADCYVKSLTHDALARFGKGDASPARDPAVVKETRKCFDDGT